MNKKWILIVALMAGLMAGCSKTDGPAQIASYPQDEPIAVYAHSPENTVIYNATLDMEVSDVERAAEHARDIAFEQGGYMVSSQSWYRDGEKHTTLVLAVPVPQFDRARDRLLQLGYLVGEWIASELVSSRQGIWDSYTQITIYLHPKDSNLPRIALPEWRPVRTFERAWGVFTSIFGYLLDIVIWVVVVAGPFVLIGLGIRKLILWRRKSSLRS